MTQGMLMVQLQSIIVISMMSCFSKSVDDLEVESLYARVVRNPRESPPGLGEHGQLEFESHRDREDEVSSSTPTRWDTHI